MSIQIYTFGIVLVAAHTGTGAGNLPNLGDEQIFSEFAHQHIAKAMVELTVIRSPRDPVIQKFPRFTFSSQQSWHRSLWEHLTQITIGAGKCQLCSGDSILHSQTVLPTDCFTSGRIHRSILSNPDIDQFCRIICLAVRGCRHICIQTLVHLFHSCVHSIFCFLHGILCIRYFGAHPALCFGYFFAHGGFRFRKVCVHSFHIFCHICFQTVHLGIEMTAQAPIIRIGQHCTCRDWLSGDITIPTFRIQNNCQFLIFLFLIPHAIVFRNDPLTLKSSHKKSPSCRCLSGCPHNSFG